MLLYGVRVGLHSCIVVCCRMASMESGCDRGIPLSVRLIVQLRNRVGCPRRFILYFVRICSYSSSISVWCVANTRKSSMVVLISVLPCVLCLVYRHGSCSELWYPSEVGNFCNPWL